MIRVGIIGTGLMARGHLRNMLPREDTVVVAVCEPSPAAFELAAAEFAAVGLPPPPNEPDWEHFVARFAPTLDAPRKAVEASRDYLLSKFGEPEPGWVVKASV